MEHEKPGGGVQGSPVLATEDEFVAPAMEAAGERGAAEQMGGVIGVVSGPDGEADELAAVEIEDPEKERIPVRRPHSADRSCFSTRPGALASPVASSRASGCRRGMCAHGDDGLADVRATRVRSLIPERYSFLRRPIPGPSVRVAARQSAVHWPQPGSLLVRVRLAHVPALVVRPAAGHHRGDRRLPFSAGRCVHRFPPARRPAPGALRPGKPLRFGPSASGDLPSGSFVRSPLGNRRELSLKRTSKAAASTSAFSLRFTSPCSSPMRSMSARIPRPCACFSRIGQRLCVASLRQPANSLGYNPCSRHQALHCASSIAAVAITTCSPAPAVQAGSPAGLDSGSLLANPRRFRPKAQRHPTTLQRHAPRWQQPPRFTRFHRLSVSRHPSLLCFAASFQILPERQRRLICPRAVRRKRAPKVIMEA